MKNNLKPYFFSILTIAILAVVFATTFFYQILFVLPVLAQTDDKIVGLEGTGGQGVLAIPNVYNGWVQNVPSIWKDILNEEQQNPN
jgi:hypothetical protein